MRIGEAARRVGVAVHVLRHWDDAGVVQPDRSGGGHRDYSEEHVARMRILLACQEIGMSLAEIRLVLTRDEVDRTAVIEQRLARIRSHRADLDLAERFLTHVIECRHDLMTRCPDCRRFSGGQVSARPGVIG